MIVKCRVNRGSDLAPYERGLYRTARTRFDELKVDQVYPVYAMALFNNGLIVLLANEYDRAGWYPIELFSVEDRHLPATWEFASAWEVTNNGPEESDLQAC